MKRFKEFVKSMVSKKPPVTKVYHGSKEARSELALPEKMKKGNEDGHAIYLSSDKEETKTYGGVLHHVDLRAHPHELMNLDSEPHKDHPEVAKKVKKLAATHRISLTGKGEHSYSKRAINQDIVHRLGKKIGYEKASEEFKKHGIVGGYGESLPKNRPPSKVYSIYDTSRLKVTKHEQ